MIVEARQVELYKTEEGEIPYEIWLDRLKDSRTRSQITVRITRLRTGNLGRYKSVGGGVIELALDFGPGYRIYIAQVGAVITLLLCAGEKRTQERDIAAAKNYWADYQRRMQPPSLGEERSAHVKAN